MRSFTWYIVLRYDSAANMRVLTTSSISQLMFCFFFSFYKYIDTCKIEDVEAVKSKIMSGYNA